MKTHRVLLLFLALLIALQCVPISVGAEVYDDFEYTVTDGKVTITKYIGEGGDVVIPSTIEGCPVTEIGAEAFFYCLALTGIAIPDTVEYIRYAAFGWCTSLTEVTLPRALHEIEDAVFLCCKGLQSVDLPDGITRIGEKRR